MMSKPQINVTPLIDVLLVLLIIFMVITPTKPSAFEARIPAEPNNDRIVDVNPEALVVVVGADSKLRLNNEVLEATVEDASRLTMRLQEVFDARERNFAYADNGSADGIPRIQRTVFIKAPRSVSYGSVARIVDSVKMGGARPISLQIDDLD